MFEARLTQGALLKRLLDSVKELVTDANFDCSETGISLQAMDNSHVALVSLSLRAEGFNPYRCDRGFSLGVNLNSLNKIMKCAGNEDIITLKADDSSADSLCLLFENSSNERVSEYELKLMDIDQEHLSIPETDYDATVMMPSAEFQRICRDLMVVSESVTIDVSKDEIKFTAEGELGTGNIKLKPTSTIDKPEESITIELGQTVSLQFSLKYLSNFTRGTPLSDQVMLCLSDNMPLLVEYKMDIGYIRYYLAPKVGDE
ncbi:proliferating cell nuclear antigen [Gigaspora margarita]|uniref:DNA sliding clamp PCNA n=2 Tax=Gigaspora margarita TaxID=4874 RepID=A0A8H4AMQ5_GIGMA|nr:proliferating cell nuclear antigen [Gigaspora margarita]